MTPEEITKMVDEETEAIMDRICGPYERRITELRRQLKWYKNAIRYQIGCDLLLLILLLWILLK